VTTISCPHCSAGGMSADANFCQRCGETMRGAPCPKCKAQSVPGDQFCTQCGGAVPGNAPGAKKKVPAGSSATAAWGVAGLFALLFLMSLFRPWDGGRDLTMSPPPGGAPVASMLGVAPNVDLSTMTPREAADRLFGRVMRAVQGGDMATAAQFLPMAIASYDRITDTNLDDRFHLSLLHAAAGDGATALQVAQEGLAISPTHLLALAGAAEAAILLEDEAAAIGFYQTLVESFDAEMALGLFEYSAEAHSNGLMDNILGEAESYLTSVGAN